MFHLDEIKVFIFVDDDDISPGATICHCVGLYFGVQTRYYRLVQNDVYKKGGVMVRKILSLSVAALVGLAACQPQAKADKHVSEASATVLAAASASMPAVSGFYGSDIRAENIGGDFTLLGHDGQQKRLSDYKGKVVALFFGYTHCPDVCPTNLLTMADALKQLGDQAHQVQVLFVSVDPERDTPQLLANYVPVFDPSFVGLTVQPEHEADLVMIKQQYKIVSQKVEREDGGYLVDHSAGIYLIDPDGHTAVYEPHGQTATELAHDIKILLE